MRPGKITQLAVRDVVHGVRANKEAPANPEALELFRGLEELGGKGLFPTGT